MSNNFGMAAIVLMALVPFGDRGLKDLAITAIAALTIPGSGTARRRMGGDRPQPQGSPPEIVRPEFSDL